MQDFIDLLPRIQMFAPTAPLPLVVDALHTAATTYCRMSNAYRYVPPVIPAVANTGTYTVTLPTGTRVCKILAAMFNGTPLLPGASALQMQVALPGEPAFYQLAGNIISFSPVPVASSADGFLLELALEPSITATGIESSFLEEHYQGIVAGAISSLLVMPARAWSSPELAGLYQRQFFDAINAAESRANGDNLPKARATTYGGY